MKCTVSRQVRGDASNFLSNFLDASDILVEKVWGGRALGRLFGVKLPKGKLIGEWWVYCGKVVIKLIDVKKPLSIQVHPSGKNGKSELWYIIKAGASTKVLGGIDLIESKVKAGDWVYLPGGTVHTILPPAVLLEISQNNLTTYRLYDWGRGTRPLDIEKGIKEIEINSKPRIYRNINSFKCPYFKVRLEKNRGFRIRKVYFILKGSAVSGVIYALTKSMVFSVSPAPARKGWVSWITKSSKTRRSGTA